MGIGFRGAIAAAHGKSDIAGPPAGSAAAPV
jgi:hypothetical protein